jgi:lysophospholipase L1-like esterase
MSGACPEAVIRIGLVLGSLAALETGARLLPLPEAAEPTTDQLELRAGAEAGGLVSGWAELEADHVWVAQPSATFVFQDVREQDLQVEALVSAMTSPDGRPQTMSVGINGASVGSFALGWTEYALVRFRLPAAALRRGDNVLRFDFRYTAVPAGSGLDRRRLAASFRRLKFSRPILPLPSRLTDNETYRALPGWRMVSEAPELFEPDSELLWRLRPGTEPPFGGPVNRRGWRGPEPHDGRRTGLRVLCLGDSRTYGNQVSFPQIWTTRLATKLAGAGQVINAGTPGYSSLQGWRLMLRVAPELDPDAIIWYFGWNDLTLTTQGPDRSIRVPSLWAVRLRAWLSRSRLFRVLDHVLRPALQARPAPGPRVPLPEFRDLLERVIAACRSRGRALILGFSTVDPAAREVLGGLAGPLERQRSIVHELAGTRGIALIDIDELVVRRNLPDVFRTAADDPVHLSAAGHELLAAEIAALLADALTAAADHRGPDARATGPFRTR